MTFTVIGSDPTARPRALRTPLWSVRATMVVLLLLFLAIIYGGITYPRLISKAMLADELEERNKELTREVERIHDLETDLTTNRILLQRMMELAGIDVDSEAVLVGDMGVTSPGGESEYSSGMSGWSSSNDASEREPADEPTPFGIPMHGSFSRGFAPDESEGARRHLGVDIAAREGTPVHATAAGTVEFAGWDESFGNYLIIDHAGGFTTCYGHNRTLFVAAGDRVRRGELIALSGNTGRSSAPHLHYEIRFEGKPVDPADYMDIESLKQVD